MFFWHVAAGSIIFLTFTVFVGIFIFQSPKPLLQHSLLVGLITATLYNIAAKDILKLQCIQNCLARVFTRFPWFFPFCSTSEISSLAPCSISHSFQTLHHCLSNAFLWRTVISIFRVSLAPKPKELRSSDFHLLSISRVKTHVGARAFSVAVPTLWNSFPEHVKSSLGAPVSFCNYYIYSKSRIIVSGYNSGYRFSMYSNVWYTNIRYTNVTSTNIYVH